MLDVGSHCGFFLRFAAERGWLAYGVEPSPPCVRFAREMNRVEAIEEGFFDSVRTHAGRSFDLVTLFDVLEHIPEPVPFLRAIRERLKPGGVVLAKVPHIQFYLGWWRTVSRLGRLGLLPRFSTYGAVPPAELRNLPTTGFFDLFEHVVHYDPSAVRAVFGAAGFFSAEILPAPPTNPPGHYLNLPRTLAYWLARALHGAGRKPGAWTHGLLILARAQSPVRLAMEDLPKGG